MKDHGWIEKSVQQPGPEDSDLWGCVLAWHKYQGLMVTGWREAQRNQYMTHWQHTVPAPEVYRMEDQD